MQAGQRIKIAIIGDVHEDWNEEADKKALESLEVDLALLVGDFGEQNVECVRSISKLPLPKAVILGNHDAWLPFGGDSSRAGDGVQEQLDLLGECHVGYGRLDFPALRLSVVGGRPFSSGGSDWESSAFFSKKRYKYKDFDESAQAIAEQALAAPQDHTLIVIAHNGPRGLGDQPDDICGIDFEKPPGGDYGDADLEAALETVRSSGRSTPLVAFGHMHHNLKNGAGIRKLIVNDPLTQTVYVNSAVVPRVKRTLMDDEECRYFTLVEMEGSEVTSVRGVWVTATLDEKPGCIVSKVVMLETDAGPAQEPSTP